MINSKGDATSGNVSNHSWIIDDVLGNKLAYRSIQGLSDAFQRCPHLKSLYLRGEAHHDLLHCERLRTLWDCISRHCAENLIGDAGAEVLSDVLSNCLNLKLLDVSHNGISRAGVAALFKGLKGSHQMQYLYIGGA